MNREEQKTKLSLKQKLALKGVKHAEKIVKKKAYKEMTKISEKHREFINEIQMKCVEIIELEPENKQGSIVATVCANIIQGFDTKKEMEMVIEMIQKTIEEYWKLDNIPQKQII